jgi:bacterioferritin
MKPRDPRIVALLNDALSYELSITNTYFLHARMLDSWGFPRLGKVFYDLSIDEMRDADSLIQRVLMFEGHPNVQRLRPITIGEDAEEMLRLALAAEVEAVDLFNAAAQECRQLGDHGTASLFDAMVLDEEAHGDWFEAQLQAIAAIGLPAYLAQQVDPASAP